MDVSLQDIFSTGSLTAVSVAALLSIILGSLQRENGNGSFWAALAGLLAGLTISIQGTGSIGTAYAGMVTTGGFADFGGALFCLAGFLTVLLSRFYISDRTRDQSEYYSLLLLSIVGMMLMAAARDLIVLFLGLETMSICFYVLAGFTRKSPAGNEAALKYFLLGAFATGFLLYGIALVYGTTATTSIPLIIEKSEVLSGEPMFILGITLLMIGLAFKVAAVPFHMWVPDVYEGAPTTITGFMSTAGKAAAFMAFVLVLGPALLGNLSEVREALAIVAALSMIVGNILAVAQESVKRMLAYSSIAHAGYVLTGVVAANTRGVEGVMYYLFAYTVMNIGAFGVLAMVESAEGKNLRFEDYTGFGRNRPALAGLMALFMFSLTGIPPFAGFFGKYYVFMGAVSAGYTWLAILGVVMSLLSAYYYLRLVVLMYFKEPVSQLEFSSSAPALTALIVSAIAIIFFGLYPVPIVDLTSRFF